MLCKINHLVSNTMKMSNSYSVLELKNVNINFCWYN